MLLIVCLAEQLMYIGKTRNLWKVLTLPVLSYLYPSHKTTFYRKKERKEKEIYFRSIFTILIIAERNKFMTIFLSWKK